MLQTKYVHHNKLKYLLENFEKEREKMFIATLALAHSPAVEKSWEYLSENLSNIFPMENSTKIISTSFISDN